MLYERNKSSSENLPVAVSFLANPRCHDLEKSQLLGMIFAVCSALHDHRPTELSSHSRIIYSPSISRQERSGRSRQVDIGQCHSANVYRQPYYANGQAALIRISA
ncbi:hypothetical protein HWV62_41603 [Athelia sp. TMB]|nr:hypothetical protein HWV62_41603 [Athelia sp. TMB]